LSAAIKQKMEKDVDEVKKTAYYIKTRIEELDKEVSTEFLFICFIQSMDILGVNLLIHSVL